MKKRVIQIVAVGSFALLMVFNVTTTINSTTDTNVDVSLSGIEAMAQTGGENLSCTDLSNCGSQASCGEPGSVEGCQLRCESGSWIYCTSTE